MTREEAIAFFKDMNECTYDNLEPIQMAIEALEQEPCGDAISRHAVLVGLASIAKAKAKSDAQKSLMGRVMFFTERLSSVTPESKIGHWIDADGDNAICGCCNRLNHLYGTYCKHCGAKMQEVRKSKWQI